jgi:hypothetical protein
MQNLLYFGILESLPAFVICFCNFGFNFLWLWLTPTEEVQNVSTFAGHMAQGYGFWACAWAIANYCVSLSTELKVRQSFARLNSLLYFVWWPLWFKAVFQSTMWLDWVVVAYGIIRGIQVIGWFYYAFIASSDSLLPAQSEKSKKQK